MKSRNVARLTGWLLVITFVTSIPALALYHNVLNDAHYVTGAGNDTQVFLGAFLEMILIVANVGSALALFSILKRQNERLALGYVAARIVESVFIAVGIVSVLSIVTLRQGGGAHADALIPVGKSLVAMHDWTFLLGPGFIVGIGNGMMLGYLMYRSALVPRRMAMLGIVGGPLVCISGVAVLFGVIDKGSAPQFIATIPEFFWELSLGIYLIVKGFKPSPLTAAYDAPPVTPPAAPLIPEPV